VTPSRILGAALLAATLLGGSVTGPAAAQSPGSASDAWRAQRRDAVVRVVEKAGPAVVSIATETVREDEDFLDPFEFFFGGRRPGRPRSRTERSLGSGVIVDAEGHVLTNDHVVSAATRITVTLSDRREVAADLVGSDKASDLAVLKLTGKGPWPVAPIGRSDDLMPGETVIAIGNPFGLENTVTVGVVSALGRQLASPDETIYTDFIQTDAAINPGNSGGALMNVLGELVGINSQIVGRGAQNLGFAIPVDRAKRVYRELVTYGRVRPAWTGLVLEDVEGDDAKVMGLDGPGVFVRRRFSDSPAEKADIRSGDVLQAVGGQKVTNVADVVTAFARRSFGDAVPVRVLRDGKPLDRTLTLTPFPKERAPQLAWNVVGLQVAARQNLCVIEKVREGSPAEQIGLAPGMAVLEINGHEIRTIEEFHDAFPDAAYRRAVNLLIRARGGLYRATVPLTAMPGGTRPGGR
jgi:serine protease Do